MRLLLFALCSLLAGLSTFSAEPPNMLLGTQAIGGRYQFTQDEPLLESAKLIAELGSGIMKFSISKQASFGQTKANVRGSNPGLKTLAEIAAKEPTHRAVLDMPFTHFFIWAYPFHHARQRGHLQARRARSGVSRDV
jgi:hypothetical protein